jgi:glycosyltransferase involved in cell wall biosynthesis
MTRIAILPSAYPPAVGGVEELTRHLALALADAGDEVEVWTLHADDARPETVEVRDDLIVRRFPMPLPATKWSSLHRSATIGPRTLFSLRNAADAFRPDILHVICFGPNGAYATALARLTGRPLVVTLQGETVMDDTDIFDTSRVLRSALRRGLRAAAAVTACSAFTLDDAEQRFGLEPGRGLVIPNGVDLAGNHSRIADPPTDPTDPTDQTDPVDQPDLPDRPYIVALGRVVEKKGFDLLLAAYAAYAAIQENRTTPDLVIGGTGPAMDGLVETAESLHVAHRVHFPGRLHRHQVARMMAGAELFVMPSRLEPFGIVILEGWRAGVAVMATNRGGPPEFVHDGVDGVLVDPFDTPSFAAALEQLLTDDVHRRSVAAAGAARVTTFAWPAIAERYRAVYTSVLPVEATTGGSDGVAVELSRPPQGESVS